jgi:hypothetical protein
MTFLDPDGYGWKRVRGRPDSSYRVDHEMCILGYDKQAGTIDLLIRFDDQGGHCQAHRHICTTTVLVLQGEQHLDEMRPDGAVVHKVRQTGAYHLITGDQYPHRERGGPDGGVLFFSHHTTDGRLYEIVDDDNTVMHTVTIDSLVDSWENQL